MYHVLSRGNERRDIFYDDDDRRTFLNTLGEMAQRFEIELLAYVLMNNHYHLLLRSLRANLSRAMQWLGATYTNRFNARHARSGHLFQGRFKSMLVENDAYLMGLSFYIHRNPLRAGMVKRLADYPWSSYRFYAFGKTAPEWLKTERILGRYQNAGDRHAAYRLQIQHDAREEIRVWGNLHHGFILGTDEFVAAIKERFLPDAPHREIPQQRRLIKDLDLGRVLAKAAAHLGCDLGDFKKATKVSPSLVLERDLLIYVMWRLGVRTNSQIGEVFGLTGSSVSRRVGVLKSRALKDNSIREKIAELKNIIEM